MSNMADALGAVRSEIRTVERVLPFTEGHKLKCFCTECTRAWHALSTEEKEARKAALANLRAEKPVKQKAVVAPQVAKPAVVSSKEDQPRAHVKARTVPKGQVRAPHMRAGAKLAPQPDFKADQKALAEKHAGDIKRTVTVVETNPIELLNNEVLEMVIKTSRGNEKVRVEHRRNGKGLIAFVVQKTAPIPKK
jgi:hypothetical protein